MTPEERASLFVPFATGGSRRPGTGLGMMITQRIVELHGGRVLVDSIARRGTTVYLVLPLRWQPGVGGDAAGVARGRGPAGHGSIDEGGRGERT